MILFSALVLRGLDILTAKETIESKLLELTLVPMKNCAIVKDNYTGVSRGFAFVEFNSIHVVFFTTKEKQKLNETKSFVFSIRIRFWSMKNFKQRHQALKSKAKQLSFISQRTILQHRKRKNIEFVRLSMKHLTLVWLKLKTMMKIFIVDVRDHHDIDIDMNTIM